MEGCRVKYDLARHEDEIEVLQKAQEVTQAEHDEQVRDGVVHLLRTDADIVMEALTGMDADDLDGIRAAISLSFQGSNTDFDKMVGKMIVAVVTDHLTDHVENTI